MLKRKWPIIFFSFLLFLPLYAICQQAVSTVSGKPVYVIGSENIGYYPHYDFMNPDRSGYLSALLKLFATAHQLELVFVALPNKRLHLALEQGVVDFAYPDNPDWGKKPRNPTLKKYFSEPITQAMGGTIVHVQQKGKGLANFDSLVVPFGFTPIKWQQRIDNNEIRLVQVEDAIKALEMVQLQRVSGADIEFNVATHLINSQPKFTHLTMDPDLPFDIVGFRLSTYKHPEILTRLNQFIASNPEQIDALKQQYGLRSPEAILTQLKATMP